MRAAVESARRNNKPWTLDPVAVGGLSLRTGFALELLDQQPAAIRGNGSEIMALRDKAGGGRGVDTAHGSQDALPAARELARQSGAVVIVSGAVDYATDGERILAVPGGDRLMTRVVGAGCALSALVAAVVTLPGDKLQHSAAACYLFARAGEQALAESTGPGSFIPAFLDALYNLAPEDLA